MRVVGALLVIGVITLNACALRGQNAAAPKPPRSPDGQPIPIYPRLLARANVEGVVRLRVVVDSLGRPIPSELRVLSSPHDLFTRAARAAVLSWRFEQGPGSTDVWIQFELIDPRQLCNPELPAADSALVPQWYHYDPSTAHARIGVCLTPSIHRTSIP